MIAIITVIHFTEAKIELYICNHEWIGVKTIKALFLLLPVRIEVSGNLSGFNYEEIG